MLMATPFVVSTTIPSVGLVTSVTAVAAATASIPSAVVALYFYDGGRGSDKLRRLPQRQRERASAPRLHSKTCATVLFAITATPQPPLQCIEATPQHLTAAMTVKKAR